MKYTSLFVLLTLAFSSVVWGAAYTGSVSGTTNWADITWTPEGTPGAGDSAALTVGSALTLKFTGTTSVESISFTGDYGMTLSGGSLDVSSLSFSNGNKGSVAINSVINASSHFTIAAAGDTSDSGGSNGNSTSLAGSGNTFADGIEITAGLISSGSFGGASTTITLNGGGIQNLNVSNPILIGPNGGVFRKWNGDAISTISGSVSDADPTQPGVFRKTDGGQINFTGSFQNFTGTVCTAGGTSNFKGTSLNGFSGTVENKVTTKILTDSSVDLSQTTVSNVKGTLTLGGNVNPAALKALNYTAGTLTFGNGDEKAFTGDFTWGEASSKEIETVNFNYTNDYAVDAPTLNAKTLNVQNGSMTLKTANKIGTLSLQAGATVTDARNPSAAQNIGTVTLADATATLNVQGGSGNARINNINVNAGTVNFLSGSQTQISDSVNSSGKVNFKNGTKGSINNLKANSGSSVTFENGSGMTVTNLYANSGSTVTFASGANSGVTTMNVKSGASATMNGSAGWVSAANIEEGSSLTLNSATTTRFTTLMNAGTTTIKSGAKSNITSLKSSGSLTIESGATPTVTKLQVTGGTFADNQGLTVNEFVLDPSAKFTGTAATKVSGTLEIGNSTLKASATNTLSVSAPASGSSANRSLLLNGGTVTLSSSISGLAARYDASSASNFVTDGTGKITTWKDSSGNGNDAVRNSASTDYSTLATDATLSKEVVVFPDGNLNTESKVKAAIYQFKQLTDIQTVVWVVKDQSNVNPQQEGTSTSYNGRILLGDTGTYNFHRGLANSTAGGTDKQYPLFAGFAAEGVRTGTIKVDGKAASMSTTLSTADWSLVSVQLKEGTTATANLLSSDRNMLQRAWNGSMAEVLIFNRRLTDEETLNLSAYLNDKWNLNKASLNGVEYTDPFNEPIDLTDTEFIVSGSATIQSNSEIVALGKITVPEGASLNLDVPASTDLTIASLSGSGEVQADVGIQLSGTNVQVEINEDGATELVMNAKVDLSGSEFNVEFKGGFQPELGDTFQIMQAKEFMNLNEATLNVTGLELPSVFMAWSISDLGSGNYALTLTTSVPEPSSIVLLLLTAMGMFWLKRHNS